MSDLANKLPAVGTMVQKAISYPSFGMPAVPGYLWYLRGTWLQNTLDTIVDGNHFAYFTKHALGLAKAWFGKMLATGLDQAEEPFPLDLSPYFNMFGECLS